MPTEWEEALDRAMEVRARSARRQSSAARARNAHFKTQPRRPRTVRSAPCGTTTSYRYGCRCALCSEAKRAENERRPSSPLAGRRARERARQAAERAASYRAELYRQACAGARGELALLIAEQAADARTTIVRGYRIWEWNEAGASAGQEWEDPTADAALESVA